MSPSREEDARWALLERVYERMRKLTGRRLHSFPDLNQLDLADDVLHEAVLRLFRVLGVLRPHSGEHLHRLAAVQVERVLSDMVRKERLADRPTRETDKLLADTVRAGRELEPAQLAEWTEFHKCVDSLPDAERQVFVLIWYAGYKRTQAAKRLKVSVRTVKRRWQLACQLLAQQLRGWLDRG